MPGALGFAPAARLRRGAEFEQVFRHGLRIHAQHFTLILRVHADRPRLGLALARRQIASAVQRNRLKRLVREFFRHHRDALPAADWVVMARASAAAASNAELRTDLAELLQRARSRLAASESPRRVVPCHPTPPPASSSSA